MVKLIDLKDKKILHELDKDCRQSNQKIAKKVKTSKEGVNYRVKNLIKKKIVSRFFAEVNVAKLGYGVYKVYLQYHNVTEKKEKEIFDYLSKEPKTAWIAVCSGKWDIIVAFWAQDIFEFNEILSNFMNKFSNYILTKQTTTTLQYYIYSRKWLLGNKEVKISCIGGKVKIEKADNIDIEILKFLTNNARYPIINIATKLKLSPSLIIYRIKELIKKKIIMGFRIDVNLEKLNMQFCKSFIYLKNKTEEKERQLISFCEKQANINALTQCVGPWDIELELEVESFEKFHKIMREIKNKFQNLIKGYDSVLISKQSGITYIPR